MGYWVVTPFYAALAIEKVWWAGVLCFMVSSAFWSLIYIAQEIDQPFGEDANDLPLAEMQMDFNRSLVTLLDMRTQIPPGFDLDALVSRIPDTVKYKGLLTHTTHSRLAQVSGKGHFHGEKHAHGGVAVHSHWGMGRRDTPQASRSTLKSRGTLASRSTLPSRANEGASVTGNITIQAAEEKELRDFEATVVREASMTAADVADERNGEASERSRSSLDNREADERIHTQEKKFHPSASSTAPRYKPSNDLVARHPQAGYSPQPRARSPGQSSEVVFSDAGMSGISGQQSGINGQQSGINGQHSTSKSWSASSPT